jgi:hypothetical protein
MIAAKHFGNGRHYPGMVTKKPVIQTGYGLDAGGRSWFLYINQ